NKKKNKQTPNNWCTLRYEESDCLARATLRRRTDSTWPYSLKRRCSSLRSVVTGTLPTNTVRASFSAGCLSSRASLASSLWLAAAESSSCCCCSSSSSCSSDAAASSSSAAIAETARKGAAGMFEKRAVTGAVDASEEQGEGVNEQAMKARASKETLAEI